MKLRNIRLISWCLMTLHLIIRSDVTQANQQQSQNSLLVLLLDGFKWDYLDLIPESLGGFEEFIRRGVKAEHVNGIFPTLSYPSWTTLSTGLYAENHGILGNYFYNRREKTTFELHARNDQMFWWEHAEPIWTTAAKNDFHVGTILWSRSEIPIDGVLPRYVQGYENVGNWTGIENTLDKALSYLNDGFRLVMAYGEHLDNVGHRFGPKSPEIKQALSDVGLVLERFFQKLENLGLREKVNIVIVSDHGMTDASIVAGTQYHELQRYINTSNIEYSMDQGAIVQIYTKPGATLEVFNDLQVMPGVEVYKKDTIPSDYHFGDNDNVPDILIVAKKGHVILGTSGREQIPIAHHDATSVQGVHGYDPTSVFDMRTVFMATGPDFRRGAVMPAIDLVDIYQVYCHVLGINPRPHNGTWDRVKHFFSDNTDSAAFLNSVETINHISAVFLAVIALMLTQYF